MRKTIIGVMGPTETAGRSDLESARELGRLIAKECWVLLTGGRNSGVMDAALKGAGEAGGLTIGILPNDDTCNSSEAVEIAIVTDMGSARNNINVLTSDVIVACGMGAGTASEIALALKAGRSVVLLNQEKETISFFRKIGGRRILVAENPQEAVARIKKIIK